MLAAVIGALTGGYGFPLRHLIEGTFSLCGYDSRYHDGNDFMKVIQESGALDALSSLIIKKFHKTPSLPGLPDYAGDYVSRHDYGFLHGKAVLSAGSIMAPVLMLIGIPRLETACILAMGGILGMIAPPVNIPAMIIGGGIDIPYVGFELPLALLTFPLAFIFAPDVRPQICGKTGIRCNPGKAESGAWREIRV